MTKKQRRTFNADFKLQVVQMIREQGLSVGDGCRDMKLGETAVRRWLAQADEEAAGRPGIGNPSGPNQAWVSDITYIRTRSGWLYLAVVLDLYARKVVGWAMAPTMHAELLCAALQLAIAQRQPAPGLMVHSDRGSQYASALHQALLAHRSLVGNMGRKGNCWDNAVMERFFLSLKTERAWQCDYANHAEAMTDIADYIVGFYTSVRLHSKLGNLPPNAFEQQSAIKRPIVVSEKT